MNCLYRRRQSWIPQRSTLEGYYFGIHTALIRKTQLLLLSTEPLTVWLAQFTQLVADRLYGLLLHLQRR